MPRKAAAPKAPPREQIPASPPVRVEIRIGGRLRFSDNVYAPRFDIATDAGVVVFTADLEPTMVDKPASIRPPSRFIDQDDPRDRAEIIRKVHSGRRDILEEPDDDSTEP